jgi:hypothetical protein
MHRYSPDTRLDDVPKLEPGDTLVMRCTYANSLDNTAVSDALTERGRDDPSDVLRGNETLDDMWLGVFGTVIDI